MLLSLSWCLAIDVNGVCLPAIPCRGVSIKVFISFKKPELIARAFLCLNVLRSVVVITPSMLAYLLAILIGRLARRLIFLVMVFALGVTAAVL